MYLNNVTLFLCSIMKALQRCLILFWDFAAENNNSDFIKFRVKRKEKSVFFSVKIK